MADADADISGMPDPGAVGLAPKDVTAGMPHPVSLGLVPDPHSTEDAPSEADMSAERGLWSNLAQGAPRAAAGVAAAIPAGAASIAGQATGALGAALDPDHASDHLSEGRDRGRKWAENVSNLANYVPATPAGTAAARDMLGIPGTAIYATVGAPLKAALPDNAYQAVSDMGQDIGTDMQALPLLGLPGAVRGVAARVAKAAKADVPGTPPAPPVGRPLTGDDLRARPNPIPAPDGTIHQQVHPAAKPPAATDGPAVGEVGGFDVGKHVTGGGLEKVTHLGPDPENPARIRVRAENGAVITIPADEFQRISKPQEGSAEPSAAAPTQAPGQEAPAQAPPPAAGGAPSTMQSPGDAMRGSVRLFNTPTEEGVKETPRPEQQNERAASLDDLDKLSGGALPSRRTSAINGDYNDTGRDWALKETDVQPTVQQIASENHALHTAAGNVFSSIGSQFDNSVSPLTMGDRGRVTRNAIQGIEDWFGRATDQMYDAARAAHGTQPMQQFLTRADAFLKDDANYMPDGFRRSAQARLQQLKTMGDNGDGTPNSKVGPGSVGAAEKFREWLNSNRTMDNAHVVKQLKDHVDTDVSEQGGPGLFTTARALRTHQARMLEEPTGIKKLLMPGDSQGINHAIPEHKVMDYIADLPREQHEHVLNVLRAGAHLGGGELAESSAAAIREIQAHIVSRMHAAATNADGSWNARTFYNSAASYEPKMADTFKERPDVIKNLQTISKAGNTLRMDKHYPGAVGQGEKSGLGSSVIRAGGSIASSLAHEIPFGGRMVGRAIEAGTEKAAGQMSEAARNKMALSRLVDRNGKQRGAVGDLSQRDAVTHEEESMPSVGLKYHTYRTPNGGGLDVRETPGLGVRKGTMSFIPPTDRGQGWGTRMLQRAVDDAHAAGQVWHSDQNISHSQVGAYKNLARLGYDVKTRGYDDVGGAYNAHGDHVFEVRPGKKANGSQLNIGLNQGNKGEPGFRQMSKQEATGAVDSTGAKVTKASVLTPEQHGVYEPTVVASTDRPLAEHEMQDVLAKTKQSAIPQRTDAGEESMHIAPGHEEVAKQEGWDKFNPQFFREHNGQTQAEAQAPRKIVVPSSMRGSFSMRDIKKQGEKPLEGAPEGDRPNAAARAAAGAYAKKAGIDYTPLKDYRYIDPGVAKDVATAYDQMKHDPTNPRVAKAYEAFKAETLAQYKQMVKAGVKVDLNADYPYKNPREMHEDVRANNHMDIYPTEAGFGTDGAPPSDHPMLEKSPVKIGGKDATYNDLFRAVHDYYGHAAEGNGFRANGEYNAWRAHRQLYSKTARGAMDAETLGQNSWVNHGPAAALNEGASGADTIYADQKAGLLPRAVVKAAEPGVGADEHHITNQLTPDERNQLRSDTTKRLIAAFHSSPATEEYAAAALAGAAKRGWYKQSAQAIVNTFGHEAPRFAALLSAMSPQVSVQTNFANALKTYINWDKADRPQEPSAIRRIMEDSSQRSARNEDGSNVMDAWVNNGVRALTADDPTNVKLSGPKVHSFYNNLTGNVNEVTNDAWMAGFAKIDPAKLGGVLNGSGPGKSPTYLALSGKVRQAASMISRMTGETWTPAEVQETVWSWAKTAYEHAEEKGNRSIPDLVKNGDITDELIKSTPDFHQLFSSEQHRGLLQSSRFARTDDELAAGQGEGADTAGASEARTAAQAALRHHLISASERLESLRQERRAAGKKAPKEED